MDLKTLAMTSSCVVVLAGCPYVFEVDDDFPAPPAPSVAPEITFELKPRLNGIELQLMAVDAQHDLDGGHVILSNGSTSDAELGLPEDFELEAWNEAEVGVAFVELGSGWLFPDLDPGAVYEPDCNAGSSLTWSVTVVDAAGHASDTSSQILSIPAYGTLPEPDLSPPLTAGAPPLVLCASFDGPDDLARQQDVEEFDLPTPVAGDYFVHVEWAPRADLGFLLYSLPDLTIATEADVAATDPPAETATFTAGGGESWRARVVYHLAQAGTFPPYVARVLVTPL